MRIASGWLILIVVFSIIRSNTFSPDYAIFLNPEQASAIGTKEDPQARLNYELAMLANPHTGKIPVQIAQKEAIFARSIPAKSQYLEANGLRILQNTFEQSGPFNVGGRTRAIALDVKNENTIIAGGVSGGIWKTTNGGTRWKRTSDPAFRNSVTCLAQDTSPGSENIWYFGTGELLGNSARSPAAPYRGAGIYKSIDNGESWFVLSSTVDGATPDNFTSPFQYIWNIETNHKNTSAEEVIVAAYGGILRSTDGGDSWSLELGVNLLESEDLNCSTAPFYTSLHKTNDGVFIAALSSASSASLSSTCEVHTLYDGAGFFYSADGQTWENFTPPNMPLSHERTVIGASKDGKMIYFLTESENTRLWKFTVTSRSGQDLTGTWQDLSANVPMLGGSYGDYNSQGGYNMLVSVHPANPNIVYIGGTNLYRSANGFQDSAGTAWVGGYSPKDNASVYSGHYPDQHALQFLPSNPNIMLSTNDGGIRKTQNNMADTIDWVTLNNGYITSQFYSISQRHDKSTNEILGGMQDTGSYLRDAPGENPPWSRILGGDGGYNAIAPNREYIYVSFQESQIYRIILNNQNELKSFARVDPIGGGEDESPYLFINPYVLDPKNQNKMYLLGGNVIWKNENLAQIPAGLQKKTTIGWSKLRKTRIQGGTYTTIAVSETSELLYAGLFGQSPTIVKVGNPGDQDESVDFITNKGFPEGAHMSCIALNPENDDHMLVVFSNYNTPSVFESLNGGLSFTDISGNLEEYPDGRGSGPSVRWAEIVPTTDGYSYYVGTSIGLYSTSPDVSPNTTWMKEGEESIGHAVVTMLDYRTLDGRLVIGTHGNGVFETYIADARFLPPPMPESDQLVVLQNFPNPFSNTTSIAYEIPEHGDVKIDLYDDGGRLIRNLLWAPQYAGASSITWDGTNNAGVKVKPGVYVYTLSYQGQRKSHRLIYQP